MLRTFQVVILKNINWFEEEEEEEEGGGGGGGGGRCCPFQLKLRPT